MNTPAKFFVRNNEFLPVSILEFLDFTKTESIYEVIRIMHGIPLFIEEHLARFANSTRLAGLSNKFDKANIISNLIKLAAINNLKTGNIKITCTYNSMSSLISSDEMFMYFIPHHYPQLSDFQEGVKIVSLVAERPNPNAKIHHAGLRKDADDLIFKNNVFEVLLISQDGIITECSRSNIFFVSDNKVITTPIEFVLPGITRGLVIDICKKQNIVFNEQKVFFSQLNDYQAAFITGTSPKVLPVSEIDNFLFNPQHPILQKIIKSYDGIIDNYLNTFKA